VHRRSLRGVRFACSGGGEREDVSDVERAGQEIWIARGVLFEEIDPSAAPSPVCRAVSQM